VKKDNQYPGHHHQLTLGEAIPTLTSGEPRGLSEWIVSE
jgi:hypothetical protein